MIMGINLKKRSAFMMLGLLAILLVVNVFFTACGKQVNNDNNSNSNGNSSINTNSNSSNNSALNNIKFDNEKSDVLAVILNNPTTDSINKISELKTFEVDKTTEETLLIVPKYNNMNIEVKTLAYESDNLKEDKTIYKEENTKDGFGLLLKAIRPEGIPALKICIEGNDTKGEYILQYNGKDGTPDIEYIVKKND